LVAIAVASALSAFTTAQSSGPLIREDALLRGRIRGFVRMSIEVVG
jgi:hypothetical protein